MVIDSNKPGQVDTFAGSGSTLAAACAVGYQSIGIEQDLEYQELAKAAIPKLAVRGPLVTLDRDRLAVSDDDTWTLIHRAAL